MSTQHVEWFGIEFLFTLMSTKYVEIFGLAGSAYYREAVIDRTPRDMLWCLRLSKKIKIFCRLKLRVWSTHVGAKPWGLRMIKHISNIVMLNIRRGRGVRPRSRPRIGSWFQPWKQLKSAVFWKFSSSSCRRAGSRVIDSYAAEYVRTSRTLDILKIKFSSQQCFKGYDYRMRMPFGLLRSEENWAQSVSCFEWILLKKCNGKWFLLIPWGPA
jgi:hypothetical protein